MSEMRTDKILLREAKKCDCRFIWELANEPAVRLVSFSSNEISWDTHCAWFDSKLSCADSIIYIAEHYNGHKVGQIRFDYKSEGWVVSISLQAKNRGRGLGGKVLKQGLDSFFSKYIDADSVHAYIKPTNIASLKLFEHSAFNQVGTANIKDVDAAVHLLYKKRS